MEVLFSNGKMHSIKLSFVLFLEHWLHSFEQATNVTALLNLYSIFNIYFINVVQHVWLFLKINLSFDLQTVILNFIQFSTDSNRLNQLFSSSHMIKMIELRFTTWTTIITEIIIKFLDMGWRSCPFSWHIFILIQLFIIFLTQTRQICYLFRYYVKNAAKH